MDRDFGFIKDEEKKVKETEIPKEIELVERRNPSER